MKQKVCRDFQQGKCTYGDRCKFAHPQQQHSHQPYPQGGKNARSEIPTPRQSEEGGHGPQRRGDRQQRGAQQQQQQQLPRKSLGGSATPLSPTDNYPLPPPPEESAQQQQQQAQRPPQQQAMNPLTRARAMCKLLGIGTPALTATLVTSEAEATAIKFFAQGNFFRETPFADSIEKFLPPLKQQQ